jgi:hypothetical protein
MRRLLLPAFVWLLVVLVLGLCTPAARAYQTHPMGEGSSVDNDGSQVSVSWNTTTGTLSWTYSMGGGADGHSQGVWLYKVASNGSYTSTYTFFDIVNLSGASGSGSDSTHIASGDWVILAGRKWLTATSEYSDYFVWFRCGYTDVIPKKFRFQGTNTYAYGIKAVILSSDNSVLWTSGVIAPGEGWDHTEDVTHRTDGPFRGALLLPAANTDGVWVLQDLDDATPTPITDPTEGTETNDTPDPVPTDPAPEVPTSGAINTSGGQQGGIWQSTTNTTDNERLDKTTYRQGVDKIDVRLKSIYDLLNKETTKTAPTDTPTTFSTAGTAPDTPAAILPTPPTFFSGSFSSGTQIAADLPSFTVIGRTFPAVHWQFDFADYAAPIALVRGVLSIALLIGFFLLCVRSARGSSADS